MQNSRMIEFAKPISAGVPLNITGAGMDGDWVSLDNHRRAMISLQQGAWAGGTPAVTLEQATSAAGAGAKALALTERWEGTSLTDDAYDRSVVTSDTFNLPNAANRINFLEINADDLDTANGFKYFRCRVASPGANNDLLAMQYVLYDARYVAAPQTQFSAID